ncbi:MAG: MFS transporter [Chloroflexi bacterium]|nr:MFS transporter [Chloroflexota bacterium]MCL5074874.1 MFS transporter [Chloroflexota bacterium]
MDRIGDTAVREAPLGRRIWGLNKNVFVLGWVSLLTDISSEMTLTILPLFLANVLGVRVSIIGLIEGIADSTATMLNLVSGWLSDRIGKRKTLTAWGYGLSAVSKPFLYLASNWGIVLVVRFTDRVGKGIRTSPRDALIAASSPVAERGKSFGFHRALDTAGAVVGLALATLIVWFSQRGLLTLERSTFQTLVLVGIIPGLLAVLLLLLFVTEVRTAVRPAAAPSLRLHGFDRQFKFFLAIMVIFTLGNSSDAFLLLRAQTVGLSVLQIFTMLVMFNVIYTLVSFPAGILSDRLGRKRLIVLGWTAYALIYFGFAVAAAAWHIWLLYVLYGLYYGTTQGAAKAFVADVVVPAQRGTAYGLYHAAVGVAALPASIIAGLLWQMINPQATFLFGAGLALLAMLLLWTQIKEAQTLPASSG